MAIFELNHTPRQTSTIHDLRSLQTISPNPRLAAAPRRDSFRSDPQANCQRVQRGDTPPIVNILQTAGGQETNTCHGNVHCGYHRENGKERNDAHPIKQKSQKFSSNVNQSVPFTLKTFLRSATDELVARTVAHERDVTTHAGDTVFAVVLSIFLHLSHAAFA